MGAIFCGFVYEVLCKEALMPRTSPLSLFLPVALGVLLAPTAGAKPKPDPLAPTRAKLDALAKCLGPSDALSDLRKGLMWGWNKPGTAPTLEPPKPPPPPPDYSADLDRDVSTCEAASTLANPDQKRAVLESVRNDVAVKAEDCRRFGMGRRVPVNITTVRRNQAENGWQVFYRWACAGPLQPAEIRVPNLTSPAHVELPPGVYTFRAEKKTAAGNTETVDPVTITVGSSPTVPLELPIL